MLKFCPRRRDYKVNPGSKAAQKGIREGDVISSINGQSTRTITNSDAHALLRNAGQTLHLGLNEECSGSPKRRQYRTVQEVKTSESIRRSNSVSSSSCASTSTTVKTVVGPPTTTTNGPITSDTGSKKSDSQNGAVTKGASSTSSSASNGKGRTAQQSEDASPPTSGTSKRKHRRGRGGRRKGRSSGSENKPQVMSPVSEGQEKTSESDSNVPSDGANIVEGITSSESSAVVSPSSTEVPPLLPRLHMAESYEEEAEEGLLAAEIEEGRTATEQVVVTSVVVSECYYRRLVSEVTATNVLKVDSEECDRLAVEDQTSTDTAVPVASVKLENMAQGENRNDGDGVLKRDGDLNLVAAENCNITVTENSAGNCKELNVTGEKVEAEQSEMIEHEDDILLSTVTVIKSNDERFTEQSSDVPESNIAAVKEEVKTESVLITESRSFSSDVIRVDSRQIIMKSPITVSLENMAEQRIEAVSKTNDDESDKLLDELQTHLLSRKNNSPIDFDPSQRVILADLRNKPFYTTANEACHVARKECVTAEHAVETSTGKDPDVKEQQLKEYTAYIMEDDESWETVGEFDVSGHADNSAVTGSSHLEHQADVPCILTSNTTALHQDAETTDEEDDYKLSLEDKELLEPIPPMPEHEEENLRIFLQSLNLAESPEVPHFGRCVSLEEPIVIEDIPSRRAKKRAYVSEVQFYKPRTLEVIQEEMSDVSDTERRVENGFHDDEPAENMIPSGGWIREWEDAMYNPETNQVIIITNPKKGLVSEEDENGAEYLESGDIEGESVQMEHATDDFEDKSEHNTEDEEVSVPKETGAIKRTVVITETSRVIHGNVESYRQVHEKRSWLQGKEHLWRPSVIISEADSATGSGDDDSCGEQKVELVESSDDCDREGPRFRTVGRGVEIVCLDDGDSTPTLCEEEEEEGKVKEGDDSGIPHVQEVTVRRDVATERQGGVEVVFLEDDSSTSESSVPVTQDEGEDADGEEDAADRNYKARSPKGRRISPSKIDTKPFEIQDKEKSPSKHKRYLREKNHETKEIILAELNESSKAVLTSTEPFISTTANKDNPSQLQGSTSTNVENNTSDVSDRSFLDTPKSERVIIHRVQGNILDEADASTPTASKIPPKQNSIPCENLINVNSEYNKSQDTIPHDSDSSKSLHGSIEPKIVLNADTIENNESESKDEANDKHSENDNVSTGTVSSERKMVYTSNVKFCHGTAFCYIDLPLQTTNKASLSDAHLTEKSDGVEPTSAEKCVENDIEVKEKPAFDQNNFEFIKRLLAVMPQQDTDDRKRIYSLLSQLTLAQISTLSPAFKENLDSLVRLNTEQPRADAQSLSPNNKTDGEVRAENVEDDDEVTPPVHSRGGSTSSDATSHNTALYNPSLSRASSEADVSASCDDPDSVASRVRPAGMQSQQQVKRLKELAIERVEALPYGLLILKELGLQKRGGTPPPPERRYLPSVSDIKEQIQSSEYTDESIIRPLFIGSLPDLTSINDSTRELLCPPESPLPPPVPSQHPAMYQPSPMESPAESPLPPPVPTPPTEGANWMGMPTLADPRLLVCLSPAQQRTYDKGYGQTVEDPDRLLDLHCKFQERRSYHEQSHQHCSLSRSSTPGENTPRHVASPLPTENKVHLSPRAHQRLNQQIIPNSNKEQSSSTVNERYNTRIPEQQKSSPKPKDPRGTEPKTGSVEAGTARYTPRSTPGSASPSRSGVTSPDAKIPGRSEIANRLLAILRAQRPELWQQQEEMVRSRPSSWYTWDDNKQARLKAHHLSEWINLARTPTPTPPMSPIERPSSEVQPCKSPDEEEKFRLLTEQLSNLARELEERERRKLQQGKRLSLPPNLPGKVEQRLLDSSRPPVPQQRTRQFEADKYIISKKGDIAVFQSEVNEKPKWDQQRPKLQRPKSMTDSIVTDGELFRQQMYLEYMNKVAERAERRRLKVILLSTRPEDNIPPELLKRSNSLSSLDTVDGSKVPAHELESEFMGKVRERMDKLGLKYEDDNNTNPDVTAEAEVKVASREVTATAATTTTGVDGRYVIQGCDSAVQQLPKHLQEFLVLSAESDSEGPVKIAPSFKATSPVPGVWTPSQKSSQPEPIDPPKSEDRKKDDDATAVVWTPRSAGASPTAERKEFRPVSFESPTLARKNRSPTPAATKPEDTRVSSTPTTPPATSTTDYSSVLPPWQHEEHITTSTTTSTSRLVQSQSAPASGLSVLAGGGPSNTGKLPRAQNPTITLLQKAREGQLPRGALYLDHKMSSKDDRSRVGENEILYSVKNEYVKDTEGGHQKKVVELTPRKFEGIGPTTKDGIPIGLRSEVKDINQAKWYKRMYDSLHRAGKDDDYITIRYKPRRGHYPYAYAGGYLSEPEPAGYDSDIGYSAKYATLDRRRIKNKENDFTTSTLPRSKYVPHPSTLKYASDVYKNQPGRIEDYEPGHSSISEKEAKQWWDEVLEIFDGWLDTHASPPNYRSLLADAVYQRASTNQHQTAPSTPSNKPFMTYALKESGYESDSTLVFKRRDENLQNQISPAEQKMAYKTIQKGGDIPLHGLRKPAPERPKDISEIEYFPISPHLTRIRVHKQNITPLREIICYPVTTHTTSPPPVFSSYKRTAPSYIYVSPAATRPAPPPPAVPPSPPRRRSSRHNTTLQMWSKMRHATDPDIKSRHSSCFKSSPGDTNVKYLRDRLSHKFQSSSSTTSPARVCRTKESDTKFDRSSRASSATSRTTSPSPARSLTRKQSPDNQTGVKQKSDSSLQRSRRAQQELSSRLSRSPDLSAPSAVKRVLQKQKQDVKERPGSRQLPPGTVVRSSTAVYASARNSARHSEDKSLRVTVAISAKGRELLGSSVESRRGPYSKSPSPSVSPSSVGRRTSVSPRSRTDSVNVGSTGRGSPSLSTVGSKSKSKIVTNSPPTSAVKRPVRSASRELVSSDTSRPLRSVRATTLTPAATTDEGTKKMKKTDKAISEIRKRTREKISAALSKTPPIPTTKTLVRKSSATACMSPVGENTKKDDKPAIESTLKKKITRKLKVENGNSSNGAGDTKKTSSSRKNGTHSKQSSRSKTNSDSASGKRGKPDKLSSSVTTQAFPIAGTSTMEEPLSQFGSELDLISHTPGPLKSDSFFQHLLLRDIQSPTPSVSSSLCRSSSVLEKARKFYEQTRESRVPYKSEPYLGLLNVYLSQKRPVTESKFRSLDRELRTSRSPSPSRASARPGRYHSFHSSPRVMDYVAGYHSLGPSRGRSPDSVVESVKERRSISEPPISSTSITTRSQSPAMSVKFSSPRIVSPPRSPRRVSPSSSTRRISPPPSPTPSPSCRRIRGARGQIARTVESVVGVRRKGVRARSAGEVDDLKQHRRTRSPLPSTTQSISSLNLSHITDHSDYQSYVLELMHSTKKSERFRELHKFYASLERMGQLERTTSTGDLRPRLKGEEVIDFDRWKQLRIKEKAEQELKVLYDKLKEAQREKDLLFMPHDAESLRWKEERDIGLRCKDKSVEDLRYHFRKLSIEESEIESSRRKEIDSQKDLYKPLWRGSSVLNLASSLTHTVASHRGRAVIDESKVKQDSTITKSSPPAISKKLGKGIGSRLWSSLSLDQVNALKHQLSEIYSSVSNLRSHKKKAEQEKSKEDYEITVPPKKTLEASTARPDDKEPLHVRCNSLLTREQLYSPMVRRREARRTESMKADSISSLPHCRRNGVDNGSPKAEVVRSQSARVGKPLSETEKKRLSLTLSQEVLDRVTKKHQKDPPPVVMARETRGAIAAAAASKSKLKTPSPSYSPLLSETASPRTCYSLEMSEEDGHATASTSGGHRGKNDFLLVLTPNDDSQSRHHEVQKVVEEWANAKPYKPPQPEEVRSMDNGVTAKLVKTTSASETESASSETSTRTVIHCSSKEDVQRKVEYFEHRSMADQEPKRIGARVCRSASDIRPSRPHLLTSSSRAKSAPSSFSSVQPAPREKPCLIPSQSYADLKELFGEQHRARYTTIPVPTHKRQQSTSPLRCGTTSADDGELRSGGTSPFRTYYSSSSTESLFKSRSRSVSPDPTKYWRAYLRMVRCGSVRRLREKFESLEDLYLTARGRERIPLKRYRSDPELTRDLLSRHGTYANRVVVRGQECGDVRWLRRRYEGYNTRGRSRARKGRISPVLKVPLRAEDRFMPHINVISKTATLQQQRRSATLPSRELDSEDYITHYHKGEVQRMKRKFESMQKDLSLMGQMFTSTPDVRELRHIAPYLGCHWIAHRYPEPHTPSPRSLSSPELRPPAPAEPRRRPASSSPARPRSSILKQQQQTPPQPPPSPKHESRTRDMFANQEFDPSIHRPAYRYQPPVSADSSGSQWWWRHPPARPTVTFKGDHISHPSSAQFFDCTAA